MSKPRYHLEQRVPELEDLERKNLFEKREITMIMRRRTDFEYRIVGRGTTAGDFLRYVEFESNLEKLRKKRYARLSKVGIVDTKPSISDWAGVRGVLYLFQRATSRFPGDMSIWTAYLKYAKKNGATKVVYRAYSSLLQKNPTNVDAWLSAAKYEFETNANAKGARILLQRALRLNPESQELWLSYANFELAYISKLLARRQILGLITEKQQKQQQESEEKAVAQSVEDSSKFVAGGSEDFDQDEIVLPNGPEDEPQDLNKQLNHLPEADMNMLGNPETNPALRGDVALSIFDISVETLVKYVPKYSTMTNEKEKTFQIAHDFLENFDKFDNLNRAHLVGHVVEVLLRKYPDDLRSLSLDITTPIRNAKVTDEDFSSLLQLSVNKFLAYKAKLVKSGDKNGLTEMYVEELNKYLQEGNERVGMLLKAIIKKCREA